VRRTSSPPSVRPDEARHAAAIGVDGGRGAGLGGRPADVPGYSFYPPLAGLIGETEATALYAGPSAGIVHTVEPAGVIVRQIMREAETVLHRLSHHLCAD